MPRPAFTLATRGPRSIGRVGTAREDEALMQQFYLADVRALSDADHLIATFGDSAALEAAARASRSRDLGNYIHFCRWRQVERLIDLLERREAVGTVH